MKAEKERETEGLVAEVADDSGKICEEWEIRLGEEGEWESS